MKSYNKKRIMSEGLFILLFLILLVGARGKANIVTVAIIGLIISCAISIWYIVKEAKRKKVTN